jgi:ergothioneine biosynthesis protein EgtB
MIERVQALAGRYHEVRAYTHKLAEPLSVEDQCIQSMADASPTKWHMAHTSWFFETLLLKPHLPEYRVFDASFAYLFNSYYEALGPRHPRPQRGLLTRPTQEDVLAYRRHIDGAMEQLLAQVDSNTFATIAGLIELGLNHEQQHQELVLTDILHAFSRNPLMPAYSAEWQSGQTSAHGGVEWLDGPAGVVEIGYAGNGFAYDNEMPRHNTLLHPYQIADRLVRCGEYAAFIADGGYQRPELWLSDGWAMVQREGWRAPLYWYAPDDIPFKQARIDGIWQVFGLAGLQPMQPEAPVTQLSFYEAAAFAEWAGARLPTEFEWEASWALPGMREMTGHAWQWTRSSYDPYAGFKPLAGAVGEYNGKFMVGQLVLRGGSVATPPGHTRPSYRNFFPPAARWQFSGVRLAR